MSKLSEIVERKFIESFDINEWEIETDTGWEDISSIHKTIEYEEWEIETQDGFSLIGADTHIIFDENFQEIFLKDCVKGNSIITKNGTSEVKYCRKLQSSSNMYDITVDSNNHRFYTNGILSHNTEAFRAFIIWYILFNDYKTISVVADKEKTANEIIGKIQLSYQQLPIWMQLGVEEFNKGSIILENGSRVFASATSSSSLVGFTVHIIIIDEAALIENWDDFYGAVRPTISAGKETKLIMASTPRGLNHYYEFFQGSDLGEGEKKNTNGFKAFFIPWDRVPGRDEKWKEQELASMNYNYAKFDQEYNCIAGNSMITLRDKITGEIKKLTIEEAYSIM